jgi:hypothetical protein
MTEKKFFLIITFLIFLELLVDNILYFTSVISFKASLSIILANILTLANFIGSIYSIKVNWRKDLRKMLSNYLIGIGIRMPLLLGFMVISLLFLDLNSIIFIFSLLILYIFFLIAEILFLLKIVKH